MACSGYIGSMDQRTIILTLLDQICNAVPGRSQANNATAAGNENSIAGIVTALETLNATLVETNRVVGGLRDDLTFLVGLQKDSAGQIALLQADVERIGRAINEAGIKVDVTADIQSLFSPQSEVWSTVRANYGLSGEEPIFLKIEPRN